MRHVRPQVQQATVFLIIVTPCNAKPRLPEKQQLRIGRGGRERLRRHMFLAPAAVERVEGLGHDGRGARVAVSACFGGTVAGPAIDVGHDLGHLVKSESFTIPSPTALSQGSTVSRPQAGDLLASGFLP